MKENVSKVKRQPSEWEKIIANAPQSAICNANLQALASEIDVLCENVLSCWAGAEWKRHRSPPASSGCQR